MKRQSGFTLIELVVVIIVLGILAVTAAPKFIDLQNDARAATLEGVKASVQSANSMIYAKAAINGDESKKCSDGTVTCDDITVDGTDFQAEYGYLRAENLTTALDLDTTANTGEWTIDTTNAPKNGTANALIYPQSFSIEAASKKATKECYVTYTEAANASTPPVVAVVDTDC